MATMDEFVETLGSFVMMVFMMMIVRAITEDVTGEMEALPPGGRGYYLPPPRTQRYGDEGPYHPQPWMYWHDVFAPVGTFLVSEMLEKAGENFPQRVPRWLTDAQRDELERKWGFAATRWSEFMAPRGNFDRARELAKLYVEKIGP